MKMKEIGPGGGVPGALFGSSMNEFTLKLLVPNLFPLELYKNAFQ